MNKSILFICHGNICRSPMAEYIFKYLTNNKYHISSRATSTEEIGNDLYYETKKILDKYHIPYNKHTSNQITLDDYNNYDLIIYFDDYNLTNLRKLLPNINKVIKLSDKDIEDPWYTRDFDKCYKEIYDSCLILKDKLEKGEL